MKKKLFFAILFFFPTFIFASESNNFNPSKTVIIESSQNYVILENKSALIETKNVAGGIDFNRKFGDEAASECQRQGNKTWFRSSDGRNSGVDSAYYKVLSHHSAKFLCLSEKEKVVEILNSYLNSQSSSCALITKSNKEICDLLSGWISDYKFRLKEIDANDEVGNLNSIVQKQDTCKTLGFEIGTSPNGECVLKLMQLESDMNKTEEERTVFIQNNDNKSANNILADQLLRQQKINQSLSLLQLSNNLMNFGKPKINCRQTLSGFSCY